MRYCDRLSKRNRTGKDLFIVLLTVFCMAVGGIPSVLAEDSGPCSTCSTPSGTDQEEYLSDLNGFKAFKSVTSAGKCIVSVFFPAKKAVLDLLNGVSLTQDSVEFIDKIQKEKPDWLATADTGVSAVNLASNIAQVMSTKFADQVEAMTNKVGGYLPGFSVVLNCGSTGYDIYKLVTSYIDAVDFAVDSISVQPIQKTLPKDDFFYPGIRWTDGAYAEKYQGEETWRVDMRLRQIGGDPAQVGTHWDRISVLEHWNNGVPLGLFYRSDNHDLVTDGSDFGSTPGKAASPSFYTTINESAFSGTQGVRAGTNLYEIRMTYNTAGFLGLFLGEEEARTYFSVYPDANRPADPDDPTPVLDEIDDDGGDDGEASPEEPPYRTPGRDHADENLSVANKDVPDATPADLRIAYTRLATAKGLDLVLERELLKEARQAEKHFFDLLAQDPENPQYQWKWAGATHRIKTHMAALSGRAEEMMGQYLSAPNVAVLDRGYSDRVRRLLRRLHIPSVPVGTNFSPDIVEDHPILLIPSAGLYGLDRSDMFKARLEAFAREGGTIVCLTQQQGEDFRSLPTGALAGYGWLEDQSCHTRSMSIASVHPVLAGQDEAILDAGVDGFFTDLPPDTEVLLRRTKNNMPAGVLYPYGAGRVIALCLYSDWISGLGGETRDDRALIADIVHWAENPETGIPEHRAGAAVTVPVPLANPTDEQATHVVFQTFRPDGTLFSSEVLDLPVGPGETATVTYAVPETPDQPGLWSVDYVLLDFDGTTRVFDFEEPEVRFQTLGARFSVRQDIDVVTALNAYNFYITSGREVYFTGEQGTFTFTVENNTPSDQVLTVAYYYYHHSFEYSRRDAQTYGSYSTPLTRTVTVPAGGQTRFDHTVTILGGDRVFARLLTQSGRELRKADRQIMVSNLKEIVQVGSRLETYEAGETVEVDFRIEPTGGRELGGEARITVRDPGSQVVYTSDPISLAGTDPVILTLSDFILPGTSTAGYYRVTAEIYDTYGIRTGGATSTFRVPEKPVYGAIRVPAVIDPRAPAIFVLALSNATGAPVQGASVDFFVEAPDGTVLFHETRDLGTLPLGSTDATFDVDFSGVHGLGQYTARYEFASSAPAVLRQARKHFLRSFSYTVQLDKRTYLPTQDGLITFAATNTGIFDEPVSLSFTLEGTAVTIQDEIVIAASDVFTNAYPFAVPSLGKGAYPVQCRIEEYPEAAKSVTLLIRPEDIGIAFRADSAQAGSLYSIQIDSPNPLPLPSLYRFRVMTLFGEPLYEETGETTLAARAFTTVNVVLPQVIADGTYAILFELVDPINGALLKRAQQALFLGGGVTMDILSAPDRDPYATGDTASITTEVTSGSPVEIRNARLDVSVVSTVDTGEFEWAGQEGLLGELFVPFRLATPTNTAVAFMDLDGDGDKDLAACAQGALNFYENESLLDRQKWTLRPDWKTGYGTAYTQALTLGDLTNDGNPDLLVLDNSYNLHAYRNTGTAESPAWQEDGSLRSGLPSPYTVWSIRLIDIDLDGDLDFYASTSSGSKYGYRNTGSVDAPQFTADDAGLCSGLGAPGAGMAFVNLNADDRVDLMAFYGSTSSYVADFYLNTTADGAAAVTWQKQTTETITYAYNQTKVNRWGFKNFWGLGLNNTARTGAAPIQGMVDVNGDGREDFVLTDDSGYVYVYLDDPASVENTLGESHYFVLDGMVEVLAPFRHLGGWEAPVVNLADLDGDGDEEIVTSSLNQGNPSCQMAAVLENVGSEAHPQWKHDQTLERALNADIAYYHSSSDTYLYVQSLALADIDGDGLKDVMTYGAKPGLNDGRLWQIWSYRNLGGNPPDFQAVDWLESVWSTMPHHYRPQPYEAARKIDHSFNFRVLDFDGDGDKDLFMSYTWERYGYSYSDYLDTRGTFVAYENTGTLQSPVFTRKTAWETGLSQVILGSVYGTSFTYGVDLKDFDGDGTVEALVSRNLPEGIISYRYDGSAWVRDDTFAVGITLAEPSKSSSPSLVDLDGNGEDELVVTVAQTGVVEAFHISREQAFGVLESTQQTFTGSLVHETPLGVLPVPGRMNLKATLTSERGQVLGEFQDQFYVLDSGQSVLLRLKADRPGYKAGGSAVLSGLIRNLGALEVSGTLALTHKGTGANLGLSEDLTLPPGETYAFEVTVVDLENGFFALLSFNDFTTLARVDVIDPVLAVTVDAPDAVKSQGAFQATVTLSNAAAIPVDVTVTVDQVTDTLTVGPGSTETLVRSLAVSETRTLVFEIRGDYSETIEKTVIYEPGATVVFAVQAAYPSGRFTIPFTVSNPGTLDDTFSLVFTGDVTRTLPVDAPAGSETEYVLELDAADLGHGSHAVQWQTPQAGGTLQFLVVRETDLVFSSFSFAGLEGDETTGFSVAFDCAVRNQGLTDFAGTLVCEIPDAARKHTALELRAGEEKQLRLTLPAPPESGTYPCEASVVAENETLGSAQALFTLASGLDVTAFPQGVSGVPDGELSFAFTVRNNGSRPETLNALFTFPFGFGTENSRRAYLNPGEERTISFTVQVPDDAPDGHYTAALTVNERSYDVPFQVTGVRVEAAASLDKDTYLSDGTDRCTVTLAVTNLNSAFNGTALYAVATYDGRQQGVDFLLQDSTVIGFAFDVTAGNGRVNWGIYQASGRSLVLNDILVRTVEPGLSLATDKRFYYAGETVILPFSPTSSGTLTLKAPDLSWEQSLEVTAGQGIEIPIPLEPDVSSGTYVLVGTLETGEGTLSQTVFFDVIGRSVRPAEFTLSKTSYFPRDVVEASLTVESNTAFDGLLIATISTEAGGVQDLFSGAVHIAEGKTTLPVGGNFETEVSGIHFLNLKIVSPSDEGMSYLTCSKAFDVGGIVLLGLSTDQDLYPSDTQSVVLKLVAFGSEPGRAEVLINGEYHTTVTLTPESAAEARVEIPATALEPGEVQIQASVTSNGLTSARRTVFFFGPDLPDLLPTALHVTGEAGKTVLTGTAANRGETAAENVQVSFLVNGSPQAALTVDRIAPKGTADVRTEIGEVLGGGTVSITVSLPGGRERDVSNNTLSMTLESVNHAPRITSLGPETDQPYGLSYVVTWTASDEDGDPLLVDIYVDNDTDPFNGRTAMVLAHPNTGSATVSLSSAPMGVYFVSVTVQDGKHALATAYSAGRIGIEDTDGDGIRNEADNCPDEANPAQEDGDGDGYGDACDPFPNDPDEWADSDGDGMGDRGDGCPDDPGKTSPGRCGCGIPDLDSDGDGSFDCEDLFPDDPGDWADADRDGIGDNADPDDDNDGMPDGWEIRYGLNPLDPDDAGRDLDGDGLSNLEEFEADRDPGNRPPEAPALMYPEPVSVDVPFEPELLTGPFADPDQDEHGWTEWQVGVAEDDFSEESLVLWIESSLCLTRLSVAHFVLETGSIYFWRARFVDDRGEPSAWSEVSSFATVMTDDRDPNGDGIPEDQEIQDDLLDLDGNGEADITQGDLLCLHALTGGAQVALSGVTNVVSLDAMESIDQESLSESVNKPDHLPFGLIGFKVGVAHPGDEAQVMIYFSEPVPAASRWYKYDVAGGWQDYSANAEFSADGKSVLIFLKDGDFGDSDGAANGVIIDPSGPGVASAGSSSGVEGGGGSGCFIAAAEEEAGLRAAWVLVLALVLGGAVVLPTVKRAR